MKARAVQRREARPLDPSPPAGRFGFARPSRETDAVAAAKRDARIRRWVLFGYQAAAVGMFLVWLARELFVGDPAASKLALSFLSGFMGYLLPRR